MQLSLFGFFANQFPNSFCNLMRLLTIVIVGAGSNYTRADRLFDLQLRTSCGTAGQRCMHRRKFLRRNAGDIANLSIGTVMYCLFCFTHSKACALCTKRRAKLSHMCAMPPVLPFKDVWPRLVIAFEVAISKGSNVDRRRLWNEIPSMSYCFRRWQNVTKDSLST